MIDEIIQYNQTFTAGKGYLPYQAEKYPKKKLAILACMDARLIELLPAALGLKNGDAKIIKNAGGMVLDPYDSAVRSLLIALLELKAEKIMVIAHTDCGVRGMETSTIREHLIQRGISRESMEAFEAAGGSLENWFDGFLSPEDSVVRSLDILRNHPLMPADVEIRGFVMDVHTGGLKEIPALWPHCHRNTQRAVFPQDIHHVICNRNAAGGSASLVPVYLNGPA